MIVAPLDTVVHLMYARAEKMLVIIVIRIMNVIVINALQIIKRIIMLIGHLSMKQ